MLLGVLAVAALAGLVWQSVGASRDAERFLPRGELVDVGGRSLHLDCRGQGEPTVVIEAGLQDWSTGWQRPQTAIARHTRVCTYDRAGLGWSDPSDDPQDGLHMVQDLHRLLSAADVQTPTVLVGHSLGGMLNRIYYEQWPEQVAGMVLLEPGDPDQLDATFAAEDGGPAFGVWVETLAGVAARLGVVRYLYRNLWETRPFPEQEVAETRALMSTAKAARALASSMRHIPLTSEQTRSNRSLGDLPLAVLYSGNLDEYGVAFDDEAERRQFIAESIAYYEGLVGLSTRGRGPIVIEGANHLTMVRDDRYWPQAVEVVLEIVDEVRGAGEAAGDLTPAPG